MKKIIEPCGLHCIKMNHLGVTIGNQTILEDVNMHIHCGTLNAVIGRNGAGKTTLIRAILNDIPHEGSIDFRDTENGHMRRMNCSPRARRHSPTTHSCRTTSATRSRN